MTVAPAKSRTRAAAFFASGPAKGPSAPSSPFAKKSLPNRRPKTSAGRVGVHHLAAAPAFVGCMGCSHPVPAGTCLGPRNPKGPAAERPICHSADRPAFLAAVAMADLMARTCASCAIFAPAGPPRPGQACMGMAVRYGAIVQCLDRHPREASR